MRDLDRVMEHYGNDPRYDRPRQGAGLRLQACLCNVGPVLYELMESVQGPNIYEEFLNEHGESVHHLGYFVKDIDMKISNMEARGFGLLQSGRGFGTDDGAYAYFDTEGACGGIFEALEMPQEMPPPERTYPDQG